MIRFFFVFLFLFSNLNSIHSYDLKYLIQNNQFDLNSNQECFDKFQFALQSFLTNKENLSQSIFKVKS